MNDKECLEQIKADFDKKLKDGLLNLQVKWLIEQAEKVERLEKEKSEVARTIARNLVAWDTSKDKREGLLPEVFLTNKVLYKRLTGEDYIQHKAMKRFHIGDDYS